MGMRKSVCGVVVVCALQVLAACTGAPTSSRSDAEPPPGAQPSTSIVAGPEPHDSQPTRTMPSATTSASDPAVSVAVAEGAAGRDEVAMVTDGVATLAGREVVLRHQPRDGLGGSLVPWAVPAADGSVYYTTWEQQEDPDQPDAGRDGAVPVISRMGPDGADRAWREGAYAPAVSVEGAVAYVEDLDGAYRGDVANPSRIVVVEPDGTSVPWTRGADVTYVTAAWAGSTLLAYTVGEGEHLSVLAFDGSGEARVLSEDGAIGAISPDGVFVVTTEPGPDGQAISLMRVSDGTVLDRLEAFGELGEMYLSYGGDWRDGLVVLPAGRTAPGRSEVGLLLLSVDGHELMVERFVAFDHPEIGYIPDWPHFIDDRRVWARASTTVGRDELYVGVECDLVELRCSTTSEPTAPANAAVARNLSRG